MSQLPNGVWRAQENPSRLDAADVLLAVEIVSPGSGRADRVTNPTEYADAGIPNYWIVDLDEPAKLTAFILVDGEYAIVTQVTGHRRSRVWPPAGSGGDHRSGLPDP